MVELTHFKNMKIRKFYPRFCYMLSSRRVQGSHFFFLLHNPAPFFPARNCIQEGRRRSERLGKNERQKVGNDGACTRKRRRTSLLNKGWEEGKACGLIEPSIYCLPLPSPDRYSIYVQNLRYT